MISRAALLLIGFGTRPTTLFSGYPATCSGLIATGAILVPATIQPQTRLDAAGWLRPVVASGRDGLSVMVSGAAIGIGIAAITSTGPGIKLDQELPALGDSIPLAALILAAIRSIVLGMGLATAASCLMTILVAGPAIMDLGVPQLGTHLFVFYHAVLSAITPPVAPAVFAAAAIAREPPLALDALRLASVGFILPIACNYHPEIVIGPRGTGRVEATTHVPFLLAGVAGLAASPVGYFFGRRTRAERLVLFAGAALILMPAFLTTLGGTGAILAIAALGYRRQRHAAWA